jgi:hypothetical protein
MNTIPHPKQKTKKRTRTVIDRDIVSLSFRALEIAADRRRLQQESADCFDAMQRLKDERDDG